MEVIEVFIEYWWLIALGFAGPYLYYFLMNFKNIKNSNTVQKIDPTFVQSDEQINLGISIKNEDIEIYKERIENLILLLHESKDKVSVNAVEAILIVELFSDSVLVNEMGELVVDAKITKKFSKTIYHDPMKFITYIKAIEARIDINNPENKIEFSDVLYMMRNARKFGLYMDNDDSDMVFRIKSAIHESNYKDVIIKIVEDVAVEQNKQIDTNIVLTNLYKHENENTDKEAEKDENIVSVEKIEDGVIKIVMKNEQIITKSDAEIFAIESPEDEVKNNKSGHKGTKVKNTNNLITMKVDNEKNEAVDEYISRFGKLDAHEEINIDKQLFRDRSLKFFSDEIFGYKKFGVEDFHVKSFFENDEKFYTHFISVLFNKEYAIHLNQLHIFIVDAKLKDRENARFVSVDIYYFLAIIYISINRAYRESFYKFIFNGKEIREDNLTIFLQNINEQVNIFRPTKDKFIFATVYAYSNKTTRTKILNINTETLGKLLKSNEEVKESYSKLKNLLEGKINTVAFGEAAKNIKAIDHRYSHDTFFRLTIEERTF